MAVMNAGKLRPADQVAVTSSLAWPLWVPQVFEVSRTEIDLFNPRQQPLPADDRGRGGVADRAACPGRLAGGPGGLADRRLQPERGLGRLAQGLSPAAAAARGEAATCLEPSEDWRG